MNTKKITTRFAVSPTGFMHIGGVRTALFSYLWARKNNGTFILRIEDTDKKREVAGAVDHIIRSLTWLGIDWDFGPDKPGDFGSCVQSERLPIYKQYAERLIEKGLAYPDPYSEAEVNEFRARAEANNELFLYRNHRPETFETWDGSKPLRLRVPEVKRYEWMDAVRGKLSAGPEMLDDIVLIKSDGYPTYNFCHIVDDIEMGVTHVMRSDEFISSMPKFLSIYDALEAERPTFVSLPPIMNDAGTKKLSKRDGAKDVIDYKNEGYLPEAMKNFLALIGWNPGTDKEVFTPEELEAEFSIACIQKSGGAFNPEKLLWMNKQHLTKVSDETYFNEVLQRLPDGVLQDPEHTERFRRLLPTIRERIHVYHEITEQAAAGEYDWVSSTPSYDANRLQWKKDSTPQDALPRLLYAVELLKSADFSSPETIKASLWEYAETIGRGELLWPVRVALTGQERSPDPFTCAYVLGQVETLKRLVIACDKIS